MSGDWIAEIPRDPRDLFTAEEQAQLDADLRAIHETRVRAEVESRNLRIG